MSVAQQAQPLFCLSERRPKKLRKSVGELGGKYIILWIPSFTHQNFVIFQLFVPFEPVLDYLLLSIVAA